MNESVDYVDFTFLESGDKVRILKRIRRTVAIWLVPAVALAWSAQLSVAASRVQPPPTDGISEPGGTSSLIIGDPPIKMYTLELYTPFQTMTSQQIAKAKAIAEAMTGGEVASVNTHYSSTGTQMANVMAQAMSPPSSGEGVESPVDSDGNPLPPPVTLPDGHEWVRVPGSETRPIKWKPQPAVPSPGGGQPGASWDPEGGHWDVDNGLGTRTRVLPDGTVVDHDNQPTPDQTVPDPFTGIDWAIVGLFAGIGTVAVILAEIILIIIGIFSGWVLASVDPHVVPGLPANKLDTTPTSVALGVC